MCDLPATSRCHHHPLETPFFQNFIFIVIAPALNSNRASWHYDALAEFAVHAKLEDWGGQERELRILAEGAVQAAAPAACQTSLAGASNPRAASVR